MQRLKNLFPKFEVHFITLLYFVLAWLGGYLKWYLATLMIVLFHEICHLMMAYYFQFDIEKIEILPFGAYLSLNDFYFHPFLEELCVVMAGPCSHILIYLIIQMCTRGVFQQYLLTMNMFVLLFNLVPIYPLDGSRMIAIMLQSVMDLKRALYLNLKISVFILSLFTFFYLRINTLVILSYLFLQQFYYMRFISKYLRQYYSCIPTLYERKHIYLNHRLTYHRNYKNYYQVGNKIISEEEMMYKLLETVKK